MTLDIRTKRLDMSLPDLTTGVDLRENISELTTGIPLSAEAASCTSMRMDLSQPTATRPVPLGAGQAATAGVALIDEEQARVATHGMSFYKTAPRAATRKIPLERPAQPRCRALRMFTSDVATFKTAHMDERPQTRDMINLKYLDYPRISEYITKLADAHGQSYTGIKLIGIYEPVPLHRAFNLKLDAISGRLSFLVRPEDPKQKKQFARVVYARVRMTGDIIQSVYPVT